MNIRRVSIGIAVAAALAAGSVAAQQNTVARLANVVGNVLVSQGDGLVAGTNGQRLPVGTQVISTAGANVTIVYDFGCDVGLKENQRFTVVTGACAALLAGVQQVAPTAAGAIGGGTAAAAGGTVTALSAGGGLFGAAVVGGLAVGGYRTIKKDNVSPN